MKRLLLVLLVALIACSDNGAPTEPTRLAPSTEMLAAREAPRAGLISVAPNIQLEYVDYGGTGESVILLAGLGNTAHVFDSFAPRLTHDFHVIGLTRRGFGASTIADDGYDTPSLADDIRVMLDSLRLVRVDIVGHSIAGDEMARFAHNHPERVRRLVYLDAAYDRIVLSAALDNHPLPPPPDLTLDDISSITAFSKYLRRVRDVRLPLEDIRAQWIFDASGVLLGEVTPLPVYFAILGGEEHADYGSVPAPSLAIFAVPSDAKDIAPWLNLSSPGWAEATELLNSVYAPAYAAQRAAFVRSVRNGRVMELVGANHYVFLSDAERVARAVLDFLGTDHTE